MPLVKNVSPAMNAYLNMVDKTGFVSADTIFASGAGSESVGKTGFFELFSKSLHDMDGLQRVAWDKMDAAESGRSDDLIGAMLASQEASLSFSMMVQARNKITAAFDDLLKMPI